MTCPYCNSKDTTSVIYLYRYNDNNTFIKKNNDEVKYSERKRKPKRLNYDGTLITDHNHNKYCNKCHKSFNSIENLYAVDISKITLVFMLSKARYKYEFIFDDKPIFIFKNIHKHWWNGIILGGIFSISIEFLQTFIGRFAQLDDVIMNTLGTLIGFLLGLFVMSFFKNKLVKK